MKARNVIPLVFIGLFSVGSAYAMTNTQAKQLEIAAFKGNTVDLAKLGAAAKSGDAAAQSWFGAYWGAKKDYAKANYWYAKANYWYKKAADQGNASAENKLGNAYYFGQGVPVDQAKADYWYEKAANQGFAKAEYNLGFDYFRGEGVSVDHAKAIYWLEKAAAQGNAGAESVLGRAYGFGHDVPMDSAKSVYWLEKSAAQGDARGEYNLAATYLGQDSAKAIYWLKKAAAQGTVRAYTALSDVYSGGFGVPKNDAKVNYYGNAGGPGENDVRISLSERQAQLVEELAANKSVRLKLFGIDLHNATRSDLRAAVKKAGLTPERVNSNYYCDNYGVNGQLRGAKTLYLCYADDNRFAYATYVFPALIDTGLVTRVINMVKEKYGAPSSMQGSADLGSVTAIWIEENGMEVKVSRGWPNTTTYLSLIDSTNKHLMDAQMQAQKVRKEKQQAQQQSNAF